MNVYCGGNRTATYGAAPDRLTAFESTNQSGGVGAMWRAADVTTHIDNNGETTCTVVPLHATGSSGYWVTIDDPSY